MCGILVAKPVGNRLGKRDENMGKNRRIPFGYVMIKGEIRADPVEISAVIKVFNEYIAGNGLTAIAKMLEADGIPYYKGESAIWNKNIVKRIIENRRYIGDEIYVWYPKAWQSFGI